MLINPSVIVLLTKKLKINKRFCLRFKKKRGFDFENVVKSKHVKFKMPTLTPKLSDLLFMTWHSWKELRKPKSKRCSHAGTICPLQFKSFSCCSCYFLFFIFYLGWIKRKRKILLLLLETCTCTDAHISTEREYWRQRDEKLEKSKRRN